MPAISATAPGKVILFGEHAVVYCRPAIAVPVAGVQAKAYFLANPLGRPGDVHILAPEIGMDSALTSLAEDHPIRLALDATARTLGVGVMPALQLKITSNIPVAAGMGSGAAVSTAVIRGLSRFLGHELAVEQVNELVYRVEQRYHGTPSGIDNTVVTYEQPVYFVRGKPFERLEDFIPFSLVIADSGIQASTAGMVGGVRSRWQENRAMYEAWFDEIEQIVIAARRAMETGNLPVLGQLMASNQVVLQKIGVSCPELDNLVDVARQAGALGAKLSGAGGGGNMIALVNPDKTGIVADELQKAGAVRTLITRVAPGGHP